MDYAQVIKEYGLEPEHVRERRYSGPPGVTKCEKRSIERHPDMDRATSYVERSNLGADGGTGGSRR